MFDDGGVGHFADCGVGGDGSVEGAGGKVAESLQLVARESGGAEGLVGSIQDELGGGRASEVSADATVDCCGRLAVQLLINDGLEEGLEGRGSGVEAHCEGAGAVDEAGEFGVGSFEVGYGFVGIEGEFAAAAVVDHGRSLRHGGGGLRRLLLRRGCGLAGEPFGEVEQI